MRADPAEEFFFDSESWEVPEKEMPYYFDRRGEIGHTSGPSAPAPATLEKVLAAAHKEEAAPAHVHPYVHGAAHHGQVELQDIVDRLDIIMSEISLSRLRSKDRSSAAQE